MTDELAPVRARRRERAIDSTLSRLARIARRVVGPERAQRINFTGDNAKLLELAAAIHDDLARAPKPGAVVQLKRPDDR